MGVISKWITYLTEFGTEPEKVVDIVPSLSKVCQYQYVEKASFWNKHSGLCYFVVCHEVDEVIKIGQTDSTLCSRFSSYAAGTQKARDKGTCSVTNYYISEEIRKGHRAGKRYSVYAYRVPPTESTIVVGNRDAIVRNKHAYAYEKVWLEEYEKFFGTRPRLSRNTSIL